MCFLDGNVLQYFQTSSRDISHHLKLEVCEGHVANRLTDEYSYVEHLNQKCDTLIKISAGEIVNPDKSKLYVEDARCLLCKRV